jgi:hypothetical protein
LELTQTRGIAGSFVDIGGFAVASSGVVIGDLLVKLSSENLHFPAKRISDAIQTKVVRRATHHSHHSFTSVDCDCVICFTSSRYDIIEHHTMTAVTTCHHRFRIRHVSGFICDEGYIVLGNVMLVIDSR